MDPDYIEQQLRRLPEKIRGFTRRYFQLNDDIQIQYTAKSILFDVNSNSPANDVLILESGKRLDELIEKTSTMIKAFSTLEDRSLEFETDVYIDPDLVEQGVTNVAIIRPAGAATMMAPCVPLPSSYFHVFFLVKTGGYLLAFGRRGDRYFFRRNNTSVQLPFPPRHLMAQDMAVAITWSLEDISISGYVGSRGKQGKRPRWESRFTDRKTDATVPPNSLYRWARRQLLLPNVDYSTPGQVFSVIIDALRTLNEEISITGDIGGFWDEQREGKRIKKLEPKREPIITRHIESRLRDITLQKNVDIMRESQLGNSQLDLLFSAPLRDGTTAKICVEVKKAHADDLVHGLSVQLPEYMRKVGTDYGIYCVLDFGPDYPPSIRQFEQQLNSGAAINNLAELDLHTLLNLTSSRLPFRNLVPVVIHVSPRPSASRL